VPFDRLHLSDRWILSRLSAAVGIVSGQLDEFRFNAAAKSLYDFVWSDYCDWYLELVKPRLTRGSPDDQQVARAVSLYVLHNIVRLMHPAAPFVTEELWDIMRHLLSDAPEHVTVSPWPPVVDAHRNTVLDDEMQHAFDVIAAIRNIRSQMNIPPAREIDCLIKVDTEVLLSSLRHLEENVRVLAKIGTLSIDKKIKKPTPSATAVIRDAEIVIPLAGVVDVAAERKRLEKELKHHTEQLERINKKLANSDFLAHAPAAVVDKEKAKRDNFETIVQRLQANLEQLVGW
jgi:valyl-tRNA synthetase